MSETPTKRRYSSTRREAQARATRRRILEAARDLFTTRGYAGTTMDAVAQTADVAVETVYSAFHNKRTLLAQLVSFAVGGDDTGTPILERPEPQRVQQETDQRRQLLIFAADMNERIARVGPLFGVMRAAAPAEPDAAELLQRMLNTRREKLRAFIEWVARNGPLRAGLSVDDATDVVWMLSSAEVRQLLVDERGWSEGKYMKWLGEALILNLLPAETEMPT